MDEIHVVPYDPQWTSRFAIERMFVAACFTTPPLRIEHVGSTAVPGLSAKPIIDIAVLVADLDHGRVALTALEAGGYAFWRENPDAGRLFLVKGLPPSAPQRTHHLHIVADPAWLERHLLFRDALRSDPGMRDTYQALKIDLAERYRADREAYTDAKTSFVEQVVARAQAERSLGPPVDPQRFDGA